MPAGPPLYAVDVSAWPRPGATTSPERGYQYHSPRRRDGHDPSRARVGLPVADPAQLGPRQLDGARSTCAGCARRRSPPPSPSRSSRPSWPRGRRPSAGRSPWSSSTRATTPPASPTPWPALPVALLIRLRSNRHFWFAPARTTAHPRGRPRRHGAKFVCDDPATWPAPTAELRVTDEAYGQVAVRAWAGLHTYVRRPVRPGVVGQYRGPRRLAHGTVVRLEVGRLPGRRRTPGRRLAVVAAPAGAGQRAAAARPRGPGRLVAGVLPAEPTWSRPSDS